MVSSKQSPIVHVQAARENGAYARYQHKSSFEYTDVVLIMIGCFVLYGLFIYYFLPTAAPASYQRALLELNYQWQVALQSLRYSLGQAFFSFSHTSVLGEWYQYLAALMMS
jgi:hypothetical protein